MNIYKVIKGRIACTSLGMKIPTKLVNCEAKDLWGGVPLGPKEWVQVETRVRSRVLEETLFHIRAQPKPMCTL